MGADTGGTFTDFVLVHRDGIRIWKVPSTPDDFSGGVLQGLGHLLASDERETPVPREGVELVHASTVATNALLERTGARTALIATRGFRDVLAIGRQARPELYNLKSRSPEPLVPGRLRFEVGERVSADGEVLVPIEAIGVEEALDRVVEEGAESVAVCLLFSFLHPEHERRIGEAAKARGLICSLSSEVAPEFREYERTSTTVINAYVGPVVSRYIGRIAAGAERAGVERMRVVHSNGGSLRPEAAGVSAVRTLLSGPAAGVLGARMAARQALEEGARIITFDMGGTSTDVSLQERELRTTARATIAGLPVLIPVVDIHTVGAGGGSIAWIDAGGGLRVGPGSAGAEPGPACYGTGEEATVTDANVVLGRIDPGRFLGGRLALDATRSAEAVGRIAAGMGVGVVTAAQSIVEIVNAGMERAIRVVSVRRGHDPRRCTLVSFGGAGGLHACALAGALGITRVLVPRNPGVLSAWGAAVSDVVREYGRTVMRPLDPQTGSTLSAAFGELGRQAEREMAGEGFGPGELVTTRAVDLRYTGQSYELTVPFDDEREALARAFHVAHERRYGHAAPGEPIEVVAVRLRTTARVEIPAPEPLGGGGFDKALLDRREDLAILDREALGAEARIPGPALLLEPYATTLVPEGWSASADRWGHVHVERREA